MVYSEQRFDPSDDYYDIEVAIKTGDVAYAREMLRDVIQSDPTAEVWYLAALVAVNQDQRISLLEKALSLDPDHERAHWALQRAKSDPGETTSASLLARIVRIFRS
jgi:Tfp pilus assembly protein PilF